MSIIETAWILKSLLLSEMGLSDLNALEEACPALLAPSIRRERKSCS